MAKGRKTSLHPPSTFTKPDEGCTKVTMGKTKARCSWIQELMKMLELCLDMWSPCDKIQEPWTQTNWAYDDSYILLPETRLQVVHAREDQLRSCANPFTLRIMFPTPTFVESRSFPPGRPVALVFRSMPVILSGWLLVSLAACLPFPFKASMPRRNEHPRSHPYLQPGLCHNL